MEQLSLENFFIRIKINYIFLDISFHFYLENPNNIF